MWCSWPARSGAAVAAIYVALPVINNYSVAADADDEFARDTMLRHGILHVHHRPATRPPTSSFTTASAGF
jgi:hypothetical protein